jgi:hypothetical protein
MESTDFNRMAPHDELRYKGTEYVLASPGDSYIAYASNLSGEIGLRQMLSGLYAFLWYDTSNGRTVGQMNIKVDSGDQAWRKPPGIGSEVAVHLKRVTPAIPSSSIR